MIKKIFLDPTIKRLVVTVRHRNCQCDGRNIKQMGGKQIVHDLCSDYSRPDQNSRRYVDGKYEAGYQVKVSCIIDYTLDKYL